MRAEAPMNALNDIRSPSGASQVTPQRFRDVLGAFATGVTIMTARGPDGARVGCTASSFNTVSLEPPLVLWSLGLRAASLSAFRATDHFGVSILAEDQRDLALHFARPAEDKFAGIAIREGAHGVPLISGALAHLECRIVARYAGGDHEIMLGEVLDLERRDGAPLVYHRGGFHGLRGL